MLRIACCNLKGGVGKTTCAVNLGAGLSRLGWRVLLVDADPQAHLTASLDLAAAADDGLAAVLAGRPVGPALRVAGGLTVLPGCGELAATETVLSGLAAPWERLLAGFAALSGFDVVLADCPPHLGALTRCVLAVSHGVVVPMTPDFLALQSLAWFAAVLRDLDRPGRPAPALRGIVMNRFSPRKRLHREVLSAVEDHFPGLPFATAVRENVALAEAPSHGQDIFTYAKHSAGARDFAALSRELARRLELAHPEAIPSPGPGRTPT